MPGNQEAGDRGREIDRLGLHLPTFFSNDPELWFALADRAFDAANITTEPTKFAHSIAHLGMQNGAEIRDLVMNPPTENPYSKLKEELIKRIGTSQTSKTRKLLEVEVMGDLKPSQFMRRLKNLGGTVVSEEVIGTIWIARLPSLAQAILAAHKDLSLDKLAELADSILETTKQEQTNTVHEIKQPIDIEGMLNLKFAQLGFQMAGLQKEINAIKEEQDNSRNEDFISKRPFRKSSNYSRGSRSRSRSSSRKRQFNAPKSGICWYHWQFGTESTKCKQPCTFSSNSEN